VTAIEPRRNTEIWLYWSDSKCRHVCVGTM